MFLELRSDHVSVDIIAHSDSHLHWHLPCHTLSNEETNPLPTSSLPCRQHVVQTLLSAFPTFESMDFALAFCIGTGIRGCAVFVAHCTVWEWAFSLWTVGSCVALCPCPQQSCCHGMSSVAYVSWGHSLVWVLFCLFVAVGCSRERVTFRAFFSWPTWCIMLLCAHACTHMHTHIWVFRSPSLLPYEY